MIQNTNSVLLSRGISWKAAVARSREYLPYAEEFDPKYIELINGYSKGSGLRFEDLFALLCQDEKGLCTDVAVNEQATCDGSVLSAHTEDWRPADQKHLVLLRCEPRGEPSFLIMTLGGLELVTGLNSAGISCSGNSLEQNDTRVGIPKMFVAHKIMASKRIGEAISASTPPERGSSYNNNICHASGEMFSIEASATDFSVLYPEDGYLVHTNHYLNPRMTTYEGLFSGSERWSLETGSSSVVRYHRALRLVRKEIGNITFQYLAGIMSDHVNHPASICQHAQTRLSPHEQVKTIYATIADLKLLEMNICIGNPCTGKFLRYSLR